MRLYPFEVSNGLNWGKFAVGRLQSELAWNSSLPGYEHRNLLQQLGYNSTDIWVLDLQTCEGAAFRHGGHAAADLNKHAIWVCPMYEPFLRWIYKQDVSDLAALPRYVDLPDAESALWGYRRPGLGAIHPHRFMSCNLRPACDGYVVGHCGLCGGDEGEPAHEETVLSAVG